MLFQWPRVDIFLLIALSTHALFDYSDSVQRYEQIIRKGIEKSASYVFPKDANSYRPTNKGNPIYTEEFDYIVIGGGSAGAVVASRLSEVQSWNILLLEAGENEDDFTDIPAMARYTLVSEYNWGFNTTPQPTCCLAMNGICPYPRGKALGGSTVLNDLVYSRGNALDYDNWANAGNPGWSYKDVLPFFIKSENSNISGDLGYHGHDGYLNVEYHLPLSERAKTFILANPERGFLVGDYNGKQQLSASPTQFTASSGRRQSSAKAFLQPAYHRNNLHISSGSYVTKIDISGKFRKARGVIFSRGNVEYYARVRKEIILSAGVFGSPQLLMLSGIGPSEHLRDLEIPVQVNLNVGKAMHDHLTFYNMYFHTQQVEPSFTLRQAIKQYIWGVGPLTTSTNTQALSFYAMTKNSTVPDFEIVFIPSLRNIYSDLSKEDASNRNESHTFQIVLVLLHPKTRGSVILRSKDPYAYPLINSRCLDDPEKEDIEKVYQGIQLILDLIQTNAFKHLRPKLKLYPQCTNNPYPSKEYWVCVIRHTAMNSYHAGGTCRMGSNPSNGDVVDAQLRVYGVTNLRVADASVIPVTLSAHMSAPAMMIGEMLAELIKHGKG